jgi:hypothetical protein
MGTLDGDGDAFGRGAGLRFVGASGVAEATDLCSRLEEAVT